MVETDAVAQRLGIELPISIDQRIAGAAKVGEHKTSMLQDVEVGRPMELDAVVGAVIELGERLDRKSTRLNSSHLVISYAVFCLKKKRNMQKPDKMTTC